LGKPDAKEGVLGIDLTKCPQPWIPAPIDGQITDEMGNPTVNLKSTVTFTARIYKCVGGQWVYPGPPRQISFSLTNVSNETGICLNKGNSANPDLWFPKQAEFDLSNDKTRDTLCEKKILGIPNPAHQHYQSARSKKKVTEITITVRSEDFGSFGFLEATASGCVPIPPRDDGQPVACPAAHCCSGSNRVKIPRDDNGNNIADVAAQDGGGAPATNDNDATPRGDPNHPGDGLSNYEEYRGFTVLDAKQNETHIRTDIGLKDLFIWDRDKQGIGYFTASGIRVHFVRRDHLNSRVRAKTTEINFNRGYATQGAQHGLLYESGHIGDVLSGEEPGYGVVLGYCYGGPGHPAQIDKVKIDPAASGPPHSVEAVRAHELGHAVNVKHHGQLDLLPGRIDPEGGLTSGGTGCVMRYDNYARKWTDGSKDFFVSDKKHPETPGSSFCSSTNGTGVNAPAGGPNNQATVGDCADEFRVNDH
jgi:hypothetical protein